MRQIDNTVLNILDGANVEGNLVKLNCGQLDRKTYQSVNKVLDALGGKWNRKAQGHIFQDDPAQVIDAAILTGQYSSSKQDFGFFETPPDLAKRVAELAEIEPGHLVLEPSAGKGALLDVHDFNRRYVRAVEIQPENVKILREKGYPTSHANFLQCRSITAFDRIIMNPPFAKQVDIDHVSHALKFLAPGGRLVAIMSAGITFRTNRKTTDFNDAVNMVSIENNPDGAFKTSGTMVNTVTVVIQL